MNLIKTVPANFGERSFNSFYGIDAHTVLSDQLDKYGLSNKVIIVSHPEIKSLFGDKIEKELKNNRIIDWILLPPGEQIKTLETVSELYIKFSELGVNKSTAVIAFGGGVLQDLVDFATATYMRGVPFVQIPTTLLSQVDIGIGGCAVDHPAGKSLIGTFYQPRLAILDQTFLSTLPKRELQNGIAEIINKICLSGKYLDDLPDDLPKILNKDLNVLSKYIIESNSIKLFIIEHDETGIKGTRFALDFGHTLTYAIEKACNYSISHGFALGVGMRAALILSEELCGLSSDVSSQVQALIEKVGLLTNVPSEIDPKTLVSYMHVDQKVKDKKIRFALLSTLGGQINLMEIEDARLIDLITTLTT